LVGKVTAGLASHRPCVPVSVTSVSTYRLNGLRKGDDHFAYTALDSMASITFYSS